MIPLTLKDIKVWPKKLIQMRYNRIVEDEISLIELELIDDRYKILNYEVNPIDKNTVIIWLNSNKKDRELFYKSIFDEEMKEIIDENIIL